MRMTRSAQIMAFTVLALLGNGCGDQVSKPPQPTAKAPAEAAPPPPSVPATAPQPPVPEPAPATQARPPVLVKPVARPPAPTVGKAPPPPPREKLGAGQCRTCHKLQYDSWVKSGHARKALDCEGCHGNGSEYAKASVMKNPAAAKAAGLIFQTADFCAKCHPTADASYLPRAHAHPKK
jgi:outer membrane biosynthesis protein TonB